MDLQLIASQARSITFNMAVLPEKKKNELLLSLAVHLQKHKDDIMAANGKDLTESKRQGLEKPLLKRLVFDEKKINDVISGIRSLVNLPDPVGKILSETELDTGLVLQQVTCPIGVIGVIFESRPDALVQISSLCLKSGNAVLLKGGAEAIHTNKILTDIIKRISADAGLDPGWISLLETRDDVKEMLTLDDYIDLIIPRGSNDFVRYIIDNSSIPVLGHADGICHVYIDEKADLDMALRIAIDAKTQYVAVCNAMETLLVHNAIAPAFLPAFKKLCDIHHVSIRGCEKTRHFIDTLLATEEDWKTEYLDYIVSVKIVDTFEEAVDHINRYGSGHTDAIVTADNFLADRFMNLVDSANVFHNCSTRFSDGYRYGLGAEVGISTNKIHARGPVGLEGLIIYKWKLRGQGHIVKDYADGIKNFCHKKRKI